MIEWMNEKRRRIFPEKTSLSQDLVNRFLTVRDELKNLGCRTSNSGSRNEDDSWTTRIVLSLPKTKEQEVMSIIKQAGIQIPDQEMHRAAREQVVGMLALAGILNATNIADEASTAEIVLYHDVGITGAQYAVMKIEK